MRLLKSIVAKLPDNWQIELKRMYYGIQIRRGTFVSEEPEFRILSDLVGAGDWVLDVGANVGHYTKRFSDLVGTTGRVVSCEPVPITFFLLSSNVQLFKNQNVTLLNFAASDKFEVVGMSIPRFSTGLSNYYEAHVSTNDDSIKVLSIVLDSIKLNKRIALVKIDVEGYEAFVLNGMRAIIESYHPILIVETNSETVIAELTSMGYLFEKLENSPNILFRPRS